MLRDGVVYLSVGGADLWQDIVDATSFKPVGIEYAMSSVANPRIRLVRHNKAPMGLLHRICQVAQKHGAEVRIVRADSWLAPKPTFGMHLMNVAPRDYQDEAMLAAALNPMGVFRAPTGSGKTMMAAAIIVAGGMPAVVVVPTIDLLYQFKDWLAAHLALNPGVVAPSNERWHIGQMGDGVVDPQPVTVTTIRTMSKILGIAYKPYEFAEYDDKDDTSLNPRALQYWVEQLGTVIVDECHILGARTVYEVATKVPALRKYGMSASPWRDDGADLMIEAAVGPSIYHCPTKRLVDGGFLMAPEIVVKSTASWWSAAAWGQVCKSCGRQVLKWTKQCPSCRGQNFRSQFTEAYKAEIVENPIRNGRIAELVSKLNRPTMVLVKQVKHGRQLQQLIPDSIFLSGRDRGQTRVDVFEQMRTGQLQTVICTTIADLGLDIPMLEALVLAGGGKSSTRHLQRIGRVVRPYPGKRRPLVVDFDDGHIHAWFRRHEQARRKIEQAEWGESAKWRHE